MRKLALTVAKRVPVVRGVVSGGVDAFATYAIGQYADRQFPPNVRVSVNRT